MWWFILFIIAIFIYIYISCPNLHFGNTAIPLYKRRDFIYPNIDNLNTITIMPSSGLSNRLRTVLGYVNVINATNKHLLVIWLPDAQCNGYFLDYFLPIDNVTFTMKTQEKVDYTGQSSPEAIASYYRLTVPKSIYNILKLTPELESKIDNFVKKHNIKNCVGIHVRRTDLTGNLFNNFLNGSNPDEDFCRYINKNSHNQPFFLATDNPDTQQFYIKKYGNRVIFFSLLYHNNNLRKSSLENAIIDIYLLSYCRKIKGTNNSTFTEIAKFIRLSRYSTL